MKKALIIISALALIIVAFLWYIGVFQSLTVVKKDAGGYLVAGLEFTGPYHKVGPSMTKADSIIRSVGFEPTKGFGVYYDNPQTTAEDKLRSYVGGVIDAFDSTKIAQLKELGLRVDSIPMKQSLVVEMKTNSSLSYMVGPMKAYPLINESLQSQACVPSTAFEIYDVPAKMTYYVMQCN